MLSYKTAFQKQPWNMKEFLFMFKKLLCVISMMLFLTAGFTYEKAYANQVGGLNVPITVKENAGVDARGFPVTAVVPLPYGNYQNLDSFRLTDSNGNNVRAQFDVLNRHYSKDNSIRHMTVNFFTYAQANDEEQFFLKDDGTGNLPGVMSVSEDSERIEVNTGAIEFVVNKKSFSLIESLRYEGKEIVLDDPLNGGVLKDRFSDLQIEAQMSPPEVTIEERGPVRTVIRVELPARFRPAGRYEDLVPGLDNVGEPLEEGDYTHEHGYCVRLYAYEGKSLLRIDFTLENSDKTVLQSWPLYLKEFTMGLKLPESMDRVRIGTCEDREGNLFDKADDVYDIYDGEVGTGVYISQKSHNLYHLEEEDGTYEKEGTRGSGWLDMSDNAGGLMVSVKDFWQTWPNALQADSEHRLVMHMFPRWGKDMYFDSSNGRYIETNTELYWLDDMQHVTKTYWLYAHGDSPSEDLERLNKLFQKKPLAVVPMEWYKQTAVTLDMSGMIPLAEKVTSSASDIEYYSEAANINSHFYHFGYDNYMADVGRRASNTTGGWPHSSAWFIASENPADYYQSEARVFGDLNARPQHLAGYNYEQDKIAGNTPLDNDWYGAMSWRYWKHNFGYPKEFAPYLEGTNWSGYTARDFEHLWMYETEEFYNLSGDRRIYDWYKFIGEFMKAHVMGSNNCPYDISDEGTTHATRAEGHVLNTLLQAYRVVGDPSYLEAAKIFVNDLKKNQTKYGNQGTSFFLDSPFQTAYLARGVIGYLDLVKDYDQQAYLDGFSVLQGFIEWNYYYGTYEYFLDTDTMTDRYGGIVDSDPTGFLLVDPVSWYYWHSGDQKVLEHMLDYMDGKLEVEEENFALPLDMKNWRGDYGGRWSCYVTGMEKQDKTLPAAVNDLHAQSLGEGRVKLSWSGDEEAAWYWVRWSDRPIVAEHTAADGYCNWWAGESVANDLTGAGSKELIIEGLADNTTLYFAVKSVDSNDNIGPISNVKQLNMGTGDIVSPSVITDLAVVEKTDTTVTLEWSIPGDDTDTGTALGYNMKISAEPMTPTVFEAAQSLTEIPLPARKTRREPKNKQQYTVTGLEKYQPYYLAMNAYDDAGNESAISNVLYFILEDADTTAPAAITDLSVDGNDIKGVTLSWTVPGDNGMTGQATAYDIRYSLSPIDDGSWDDAEKVEGGPLPAFPGATQKYTVKTLLSHTQYYFAMKTGDEADNWSLLSNITGVMTGEIDRIIPGKVTDLTATNVTDIFAELRWTATGDDGSEGIASAYELAYSTQPFTVNEWETHTKTVELPHPLPAGSTQTVMIEGLNRSTTYYFALRVIDNAQNYSELSNLLTVTTADAPSIAVGKAVTTNETNFGNFPSNLVDGDVNNPWVSGYYTAEVWVEIDLDGFYDLTGVDLIHLYNENGYGHRIDVSTDGEAWNTVASMLPMEKTGKVSHSFAAEKVHYVRLVIDDENLSQTQQRAYVGELKVYGSLSADNQYTVSFAVDGGSPVDSQVVNYNTKATEPPIPVKDGYTFAGWYADAGLVTAFNFDTAIIGDITLYAKWTINSGEPDECFIATAAFGTKFTPAVVLLRQFRDNYLLTNGLGKVFVNIYYKNSPPMAQFIAGSETLKGVVRMALIPVIATVYMIMNPLLGMALILFVIAIYFVYRRKNVIKVE